MRVTAEHLRGRSFAAAYSSPSGRAVDTANEILVHHPRTPLTRDDGLREFSLGDLEATPEAELFARVDSWSMFGQVFDGTLPRLPGGQPAAVYLDRVAAVFERVARAHGDGEEVLLVSHSVTLTAYLTMVGGVPIQALPNASISTVEITTDGTRRITAIALDPSGHGVPQPIVPRAREDRAGAIDHAPASA